MLSLMLLNDASNQRAVLLGTDIPGLTVEILKDAFDALLEKDVVLGPSTDGGYWLIGMKRPIDLFQNIEWGSSRVLEQTLAQAKRLGLQVRCFEIAFRCGYPGGFYEMAPAKERAGRPF